MKNIKEITISILIIITFYTVLTSVFKDDPAGKVWEIKAVRMANDVGVVYSINKVTGEVRFHMIKDNKVITLKK
jgi:hypothetical protein